MLGMHRILQMADLGNLGEWPQGISKHFLVIIRLPETFSLFRPT